MTAATAYASPGATFPQTVAGDELAVLDSAELYLRRGLDLKRWWDQAYRTKSFGRSFPLSVTVNRPDPEVSFGFFDVAKVEGRDMPIMGNYQALFYDRPKSTAGNAAKAAQWMRDQLRQFVLRYFMRVSHFREPDAYVPPGDRKPLPLLLRPLSWCPEENPTTIGFGFSQYFFKEAGSGRVRPFPEAERYAIVDLRRIGPELEWILPRVQIFDFKFVLQPFGAGTPSLVLPLNEGSYLVINRDFVVNEEEPTPDLLGRYGFGYAFIKNPQPSLLAYGPGEFEAAIEIIQFSVDKTGRISAEAIFVANRPTSVVNVPLNPLDWGYQAANLLTCGAARPVLGPFKRAWDLLPGSDASFDPVRLGLATANLLTGGLLAEELCVSFEQLERDFLLIHFQQHYQTLAGSLATWRQIPNWLAREDELPAWVVTGRPG